MIPEVPPYNNYSGDGATTQFDFDFYIEDGSQLKVEHINENGITSILQENIDYAINEIGNQNGSYIVFPIASSKYSELSNAEIISLQLTLPVSQESEYGKSSELDFKSLEYSFDYLTRLIQILNRKQQRAVTVQEGSGTTPDALLKTIDDKVTTAINAATSASSDASCAKEQSSIVANIAQDAITKMDESLNNITTTINNATTEINSKTNIILHDYNKFTVNIGPYDENGVPDLLQLLDGIISNKEKFTYTQADGITHNVNQTLSLDISGFTDGEYTICVDYQDGAYFLCTGNPKLDLSNPPYLAYENGNLTSKVPIGVVEISGGGVN